MLANALSWSRHWRGFNCRTGLPQPARHVLTLFRLCRLCRVTVLAHAGSTLYGQHRLHRSRSLFLVPDDCALFKSRLMSRMQGMAFCSIWSSVLGSSVLYWDLGLGIE